MKNNFNNSFSMSVGERIRQLRIKNNLTLEELGKEIKVSKQTICKYETGIVKNIPMSKIKALSFALDTSPTYILGLESDQMPPYLNEDKYMSIGDKIYYLRMKNNMTLEELGDKVGVGKSTIRKWENGTISNMRIDKITKLADALGVTPANLLGGANFKNINSIDRSSDETRKIIDLVEQLNSVGVKKAYDILEDLVSISKYKKQ